MHPIAEAIMTLFNGEGWKIQQRDERSFSFGFRAMNNRYNFFALIGENRNTLCIYAVQPMQAPADKLAEISEFLHRANFGMILGSFELDFRDGEIRFKVSEDFEDGTPDPDHINHMIDCALAMSDRYFPGVGGIIYGNKLAEDVIREIEG